MLFARRMKTISIRKRRELAGGPAWAEGTAGADRVG